MQDAFQIIGYRTTISCKSRRLNKRAFCPSKGGVCVCGLNKRCSFSKSKICNRESLRYHPQPTCLLFPIICFFSCFLNFFISFYLENRWQESFQFFMIWACKFCFFLELIMDISFSLRGSENIMIGVLSRSIVLFFFCFLH